MKLRTNWSNLIHAISSNLCQIFQFLFSSSYVWLSRRFILPFNFIVSFRFICFPSCHIFSLSSSFISKWRLLSVNPYLSYFLHMFTTTSTSALFTLQKKQRFFRLYRASNIIQSFVYIFSLLFSFWIYFLTNIQASTILRVKGCFFLPKLPQFSVFFYFIFASAKLCQYSEANITHHRICT